MNINEDTTTPNAPNIATTDENLSADDMFQQVSIPSLGRLIFPVLKMNGPVGALFNIKTNTAGDLELVRKDVEVFNSESIKTGLTQEAIQDIRSQYGKETNNIVGKLLRGLANEAENVKTLEFLDTVSLQDSDLQLHDSSNAQINLFEISQRIQELVLKTNIKNHRSFKAFAVIPYRFLAGITALTADLEMSYPGNGGLFVGRTTLIDFCINPDASSNTAYVGILDRDEPNRSSGFFSPYASTVIEETDPTTGNNKYFIFNRYAITASPLHAPNNEMFHKFNIFP